MVSVIDKNQKIDNEAVIEGNQNRLYGFQSNEMLNIITFTRVKNCNVH